MEETIRRTSMKNDDDEDDIQTLVVVNAEPFIPRRNRLVHANITWLLLLSIAVFAASSSGVAESAAAAATKEVELKVVGELEVSDDYDMNSHHAAQHTMNSDDNNDEDTGEFKNNDIIVVATVDGCIAGLSRKTGQVVWKQSGLGEPTTDNKKKQDMHYDDDSNDANYMSSLTSPLLSTTTTTKSNRPIDDWRTAAVPSVDGRVFLTAGRNSNQNEMTATSTIHDLVARAPFVDARGRFYVGSRQATATALCQETGAILQVVSGDAAALFGTSETTLEGRNIIWVGRVDYSISLFDARTGVMDVKFSSSEIMGVHDMVSADDRSSMDDATASSLSGLSQSPHAAPRLGLPNNHYDADDLLQSDQQRGLDEATTMLIATPNGNVALRNPATGNIEWVCNEKFDTPVAFALESSTGMSVYVDILPDAPVPNSSSPSYLASQLERQIDLLIRGAKDQDPEQTIVGALASGQLFAMPLGKRLSQERAAPTNTIGLPHHHHSHSSTSASSIGSKGPMIGNKKVPNLGGNRRTQQQHHHLDGGDHSQQHAAHQISAIPKKVCSPTSNNFPACLVGGIHHNHDLTAGEGGLSFLDHTTDLPEHHPTIPMMPFQLKRDEQDFIELQQFRKNKRNFYKLMESWLPATMVLIFVLSFDIGRRLKAKKRKEKEAAALGSTIQTTLSSDNLGALAGNTNGVRNVGVITVTDTVLGFGGHGTVVYRGTLDGRQVAVKRMLKAYHASADREIALLIESDGHPNVVRYFLKEVKGDFVYLALELCDMSLHDLIVKLRHVSSGGPMKPQLLSITKATLYQIACGVRHLHSLRIVHRDLKPANILLAMSGRNGAKGKGASNGDLIEDDAILSQYEHGEYVAKISDMGLGKQLTGQSSFGPSTLGKSSIQGAGNGGESSRLTGAGPGSVGWQAPEVMAVRWSSETPSVKSGNSSRTDSFLLDASSLDAPTSSRTSRSVDIFSLGCIFHCTLVPGSHPFGDWYEREANIMRNKAATGELLEASPDAHDLITSMICRDASQRPTAKEVCEHPLFWHPQKKLAFLCDISDRIESESQLVDDGKEPLTRFGANVFAIERNAAMVVGTAWDQDLDPDLLSNVSKFRSYDTSSVRDCLRLIRNKHHHYDELPAHVKERVGPNPEGLLSYFEQNFPHLLMHCYNTSKALFDVNDSLALKYSIAISPRLKNRLIAPTAKTQSMDSNDGTQEVEPPKEVEDRAPPTDACDLDLPTQKQDAPQDEISEWESMNGEEPMPAEGPALPSIPNAPNLPGDGDIVLWEGSTSAKAFNCRGWLRGDDEWARQPPARKKLDSNMTRCATDAKFRTRLCNHWDVSLGTFCPMKKRNKCVFAHGPVELRVKEGKKHRWGKLVDSSGNNSNPKHSGGEDTYGAARSIESIRKEEGKWNTEKGSKNDKSRGKGKATPAKVAVAQDPSSPVKA